MLKKVCLGLLVATAAAAASVSSHAAIVLLTGTNFDVQYDDALTGKYGTPSLSGNVVFFTPTDFKAESLNGAGITTSNGTVNIRIIPKNGFAVGNLNLQERGDYVLLGANSSVNVTGQTRAFSLSNPLFDISNSITTSSNLTIRDGLQHNWVANSNLNLASLGLAPNQVVNYTIENLLRAYTDISDLGIKQAFIEKKFSGFSITVSPVPEPSTVISMLAGLGLLGFLISCRNRRSL